MKRKLLLLFVPFILSGQLSNWDGKTAEQLANITTGTTAMSKNYFVNNAYTQIYDIINFLLNPTISDITDGDATPDISNGVVFKVSSTYSGAITGLDGTPPFNLDVKIIIDSNSCTFTNSTNFDLGGVDLSPQAGDELVFSKDTDDGKWHGRFTVIE